MSYCCQTCPRNPSDRFFQIGGKCPNPILTSVFLVVVHLCDFVWEISTLGPLDAFGNESLHFPN